jgi:cytochrome c556
MWRWKIGPVAVGPIRVAGLPPNGGGGIVAAAQQGESELRIIRIAAFGAAACVLLAAAVDPRIAIPARQDGMKQIGRNFKAVFDQLHASAPDAAVLRTSTEQLAELAGRAPTWFPGGTGPETGIKTAAKTEIWAQPADFAAKAAALASTTRALAAGAAQSSDPAVLNPLAAQVGGACKACHTSYRVPDQH